MPEKEKPRSKKPSQLLRQMRKLIGPNLTDHQLWTEKPPSSQPYLAMSDDLELDELAVISLGDAVSANNGSNIESHHLMFLQTRIEHLEKLTTKLLQEIQVLKFQERSPRS